MLSLDEVINQVKCSGPLSCLNIVWGRGGQVKKSSEWNWLFNGVTIRWLIEMIAFLDFVLFWEVSQVLMTCIVVWLFFLLSVTKFDKKCANSTQWSQSPKSWSRLTIVSAKSKIYSPRRGYLSLGNSIDLEIAAALLFISVTNSCRFWGSFCWNSSTLPTYLFIFVIYARAAGLLAPRTLLRSWLYALDLQPGDCALPQKLYTAEYIKSQKPDGITSNSFCTMKWYMNCGYEIKWSFLTGTLEPTNDQLPTSVAS